MSNINEIQNAIQINNELIALGKKNIKALTIARQTLIDTNPTYFEPAIAQIDTQIKVEMEMIDTHKAMNVKRKKQLKLIEQFNELENE